MSTGCGSNSKSCITVGPVTRTAGMLACSRLEALAAVADLESDAGGGEARSAKVRWGVGRGYPLPTGGGG